MITREKISEIAGIVRAAYEDESVDRALDLFEAIARQVPEAQVASNAGPVTVEVAPEKKPAAVHSGAGSREAGDGENTSQQGGFLQSHSSENGERPDPAPRPDRAGVPHTLQPSAKPASQGGDQGQRLSGGSALVKLTAAQKAVLQGWMTVAREAKFQLTPKAVVEATGQTYANVIQHSGRLAAIGYLKKTGSGRGTVWRVVADTDGKPFSAAVNGITKCPPARTAPDINSRMGW